MALLTLTRANIAYAKVPLLVGTFFGFDAA
jgi:hypothetical protein